MNRGFETDSVFFGLKTIQKRPPRPQREHTMAFKSLAMPRNIGGGSAAPSSLCAAPRHEVLRRKARREPHSGGTEERCLIRPVPQLLKIAPKSPNSSCHKAAHPTLQSDWTGRNSVGESEDRKSSANARGGGRPQIAERSRSRGIQICPDYNRAVTLAFCALLAMPLSTVALELRSHSELVDSAPHIPRGPPGERLC